MSRQEMSLRELVIPSRSEEEVRHHGLEFDEGYQLCWPLDDPDHPRNWGIWTKCFDTTVIILLDFFTTIISTSGSGTASKGQSEYGISNVNAIFSYTSVYLFAQAVGCLLFPAVSESFGRKPLYVYSMFMFSAFCLITASVHSIWAVLVARLLAGLVSAIPSLVVAGSVEDMYDSEARVWMIFAWGVSANIGLTTSGPIYSTYITESLGWRWVFWIGAAITLGLAVLTLFLRESRPSQILKKRLHHLNKATTSKVPWTIDNPDHFPTLHEFVTISLTRPTRLFFTEPIVFLVSLLSAIAFGQIYLLTEALPYVYTQAPFFFTNQQASLSFLPITVGLSLNVIPRFYDHYYIQRIKGQGRILKPEDKIRAFAIGAPCLAIGLWWFSWTIGPAVSTSWPVSFVPLVLIGFATNEFDCTLAGYLSDSYTIYSASAFASLAFWRALVSGALPLFTKQLYKALNSNKATSILGIVATIFCAVPVLFLKYGETLREKSVFAKLSRDAQMKMCCGSKASQLDASSSETLVGSEESWETIDLGHIWLGSGPRALKVIEE